MKKTLHKKAVKVNQSFDVIRDALNTWKALKDAKIDCLYVIWNKGWMSLYKEFKKAKLKDDVNKLNAFTEAKVIEILE